MGGGGDKMPGHRPPRHTGHTGSTAPRSSPLPLTTTSLTLHLPGSPPQKGVTTYALAQNRQKPLAGVFDAAIFNTWRRFKGQVLYIAPPMIIAYSVMQWAIEK
ncbi:Cytochrome b-c1 complex subunit 8, mitochondrial [Cryomyces antarcticus]|nr:Cytochrome b-c1 complex subunit 8, mitochondrial [Cryomyces antarcticus]